MTFVSGAFIVFVAVIFAIHWLAKPRWQNLILLGGALVFYGWWDWRYIFLLLGIVAIGFVAGQQISRTDDAGRRKAILVLAIAAHLGLLGYYKYTNFFLDVVSDASVLLGGTEPWRLDFRVLLPVGISFFTFQSLGYVIDVYRRTTTAVSDFLRFAVYVSFFPQLVAGPIERSNNLLPQFAQPRRFDATEAADGCRQMLWGFVKKVVFADNFAVVVNSSYGDVDTSSGAALLWATYAFGFQIYCDFSAYSDIAIGCARLFGIRLMTNFSYPYFSQSVREFWQRWHISLSTWFRDYVYVPLGGNRDSSWRTRFNIFVVFVLSGLWHGANWTFVAWGALHGAATVATRGARSEATAGRKKTPWARATVALRILATFHIVMFGWIFFRADSISVAFAIIGKIGEALGQLAFSRPPLLAFGLAVLLLAIEWFTRKEPHPLRMVRWPRPLRWAVYYAAVGAVLMIARLEEVPFIYFQF